MVDLKTTYMGLQLKNPLIAGSSGYTETVEMMKQLQDAGAGAVVLKSIFEEEIMMEMDHTLRESGKEGFDPGVFDYYDYKIKDNYLTHYIKLIKQAKEALSIPVIASINCVSGHEWPYFAKQLEEAGADALELNVFTLPTNTTRSCAETEQLYFDLIQKIKATVSLPVSLKISYYFNNLASFIQRLSDSGIDGLVLFNRFYSPDFDIESFKVTSANVLSSPDELYLPLRWIAVMSDRVSCDLAASTGVHDSEAMIKQLLAGAQAVQIASVLYSSGVHVIKTILDGLEEWMDKKGFASVDDFRGKMAQSRSDNPELYERVQFMKYFRGMDQG
ncbi:MAG TPA: dihydroorotate dehydrogenase-like protein [Caldithrix abyssi]|uniref:Dihydroorotate dehydrogenase-like protein n=1 Tax=Caldithrix abyssi TaxID=187145 RepID=A0A7V4TY75_CALAY|nr:dihydroorotate dehydrogenase-like protein [Caldithrix abyssi]